MINKIKQFFLDVEIEMKKVSWPTWDELKGSTIVVLTLALMLSVFLFFVDQILNRIMNIIL